MYYVYEHINMWVHACAYVHACVIFLYKFMLSQKIQFLSLVNDQRTCILAATKQLYEWASPSVRSSHLFHYVSITVSSQNFQELLTLTEVMSMQKVNVEDQRSRSQRSKPSVSISGL